MKIFLGGTCNNSNWREILMPKLEYIGVDYFNPVVDDWTPQHMETERLQREDCDYCLYVITKEMTGVFSIAEATDDSNKRPDKTIFCVLPEGFLPSQLKSLNEVGHLIYRNGGLFYTSLDEVTDFFKKVMVI